MALAAQLATKRKLWNKTAEAHCVNRGVKDQLVNHHKRGGEGLREKWGKWGGKVRDFSPRG